ncbi:hypothetical protein OUZ56_028541 [Daphnia magna]|uniref:Secreted protein n=1 Tax=Daphnia magna TaxID=35525 RepID=A0ABR0B496_9CRUS|nr:hypothetical protein OUZ56_028541 [Daphnia magna]
MSNGNSNSQQLFFFFFLFHSVPTHVIPTPKALNGDSIALVDGRLRVSRSVNSDRATEIVIRLQMRNGLRREGPSLQRWEEER